MNLIELLFARRKVGELSCLSSFFVVGYRRLAAIMLRKERDQPQLISSAEPEGNKPITKRKQRESTALFGLSFGWLWPLALLQRTNTPQLIHYSLINCCCGARPLREKKTSPRSSTTTKERAPNPHSFVGL